MILGKYFPYTFIVVIFALFFYSFTQIDLSLTFANFPLLHSIEMGFKQIGYFNRPLSTLIYILIISAMMLYFIYFLRLSLQKKLKIKFVWTIIGISSILLAFSYVAFSHDLFNYIFDAKIITYYHQNPYAHKALDFPADPMLSFMHWTHRLYPYGPVWLGLTVPISFAGLNIFLLNFFLFKFLIMIFYVGSVYFIYKINKKINPGAEIFNTVFFALNPLIIIESLVSSHNDIVMVFFALFGIYLYFLDRKILSILILFLSSQVKIPTLALLFPFGLALLSFKIFKFTSERLIQLSVLVMIFIFFAALTKYELQPWYLLWILPFVSLLKPNKYIVSISIGASVGVLLRYVFFLYLGNWDEVLYRNILTIAPILISIIVAFVWSRKKGYNLL